MFTLLAIFRAVHFASLMLVFGAESMRALLLRLPAPVTAALPRPVLETAVMAAFTSGALWIVAIAAQMDGAAPDVSIWTAIGATLQDTFFGHIAIARLALVALLFALLRAPAFLGARIGVSGLALGALSLTSHATAAGDPSLLFLRAANDAVHLLAAGFWLGALVLLLFQMRAHRSELSALIPALRLFSLWATLAVGGLVVAGALNGYLILFASHARWSQAYLSLLTAKIVLAALMISFALANRFSLLPAIAAGNSEAEETLFISTAAELAMGTLILAIVGFLGILSPFLR